MIEEIDKQDKQIILKGDEDFPSFNLRMCKKVAKLMKIIVLLSTEIEQKDQYTNFIKDKLESEVQAICDKANQ